MKTIGGGWDERLADEFKKPYYTTLMQNVERAYASERVYPPRELMFHALSRVPYESVKVLIVGQDPYHGDGQANGMAFAVNQGVKPPPSLVNIFKEILADIGAQPNGCTLTGWAAQGVLLLNTVLSVRAASPRSHNHFGWQTFTDAVIRSCAARETPMVFILWGANAAAKKPLILPHHLVLESVHPSPLSAYAGFFGCKHFSRANAFLQANGQTPIDWTYADDLDSLASYYDTAGNIRRIKPKTNEKGE